MIKTFGPKNMVPYMHIANIGVKFGGCGIYLNKKNINDDAINIFRDLFKLILKFIIHL